jgi:hypothetical protein
LLIGVIKHQVNAELCMTRMDVRDGIGRLVHANTQRKQTVRLFSHNQALAIAAAENGKTVRPLEADFRPFNGLLLDNAYE